jgi:hypothetical protein
MTWAWRACAPRSMTPSRPPPTAHRLTGPDAALRRRVGPSVKDGTDEEVQ